jgi:hypothetical protein
MLWEARSGDLLQLRRSADDEALELWQADSRDPEWKLRSRLDLDGPPAVQMEFLPLTVDADTGRLIMNRLTVESRLVVFDGIDVKRWRP